MNIEPRQAQKNHLPLQFGSEVESQLPKLSEDVKGSIRSYLTTVITPEFSGCIFVEDYLPRVELTIRKICQRVLRLARREATIPRYSLNTKELSCRTIECCGKRDLMLDEKGFKLLEKIFKEQLGMLRIEFESDYENSHAHSHHELLPELFYCTQNLSTKFIKCWWSPKNPYISRQTFYQHDPFAKVNHLWSQAKAGYETDVMIKVGEKTFPAHKTILQLTSSYFATMLKGKFKESQEGMIDFPDDPPDVVEDFLLFLYTGQISEEHTSNINHLLNLFACAHRCDDGQLKNHCIDLLDIWMGKNRINKSNFNDLFCFGLTYENATFVDACLAFVEGSEERLNCLERIEGKYLTALVTRANTLGLSKTSLFLFQRISTLLSNTNTSSEIHVNTLTIKASSAPSPISFCMPQFPNESLPFLSADHDDELFKQSNILDLFKQIKTLQNKIIKTCDPFKRGRILRKMAEMIEKKGTFYLDGEDLSSDEDGDEVLSQRSKLFDKIINLCKRSDILDRFQQSKILRKMAELIESAEFDQAPQALII